MSDALKNRLVGTVILAALAVILLPEILDGEKQVAQSKLIDVPAPAEDLEIPPINELDLDEIKETVAEPEIIESVTPQDEAFEAANQPQDASTTNEDIETATAESNITDSSTNAQVAEPLTQDEANVEDLQTEKSGWVIQLGVFSNEENVKKLVSDLTSEGYRAFTQPVNTQMGQLTKVFVGPELDRETLLRSLPELERITGLSGKITEYEVSAD